LSLPMECMPTFFVVFLLVPWSVHCNTCLACVVSVCKYVQLGSDSSAITSGLRAVAIVMYVAVP